MNAIAAVCRILESGGKLDVKQLISSVELDDRDLLHVYGSHGELKVDPGTGRIVSRDHNEEYDDIDRFNVDELHEWLVKKAPLYVHTVGYGGHVDICDIGFWTKDGRYAAPEMDHRRYAYLGVAP